MVGFIKGDSSATYTTFRGGGILANYDKELWNKIIAHLESTDFSMGFKPFDTLYTDYCISSTIYLLYDSLQILPC